MWKEIKIRNKKDSDIYAVEFSEYRNSQDIFNSNKHIFYPAKKINLFWNFETFEDLKNELYQQVYSLYKLEEINFDQFNFISEGINKYIKEKENPNFKRVIWKISEIN